mmetsp:Transcript_386/g.554  ORF Transcript_386/g.554 Transcript_386/m.554 type:complete len:147 (+) Transcript_386:93-533(+)
MKSLSSITIPISILLHFHPASSWTQPQSFGNRLMNSVLRQRENDENDDVDHERSRLERLFANRVSDFQHDDWVQLTNNNIDTPVNQWINSGDDVYSDWLDVGPCYGDECDQCEIPANYKHHDSLQVDVMDLLGIQRAEPLRVRRRL